MHAGLLSQLLLFFCLLVTEEQFFIFLVCVNVQLGNYRKTQI